MNERKKERKGEHQMHGHEKIFFALCFRLTILGVKPRDVVHALGDTCEHPNRPLGCRCQRSIYPIGWEEKED